MMNARYVKKSWLYLVLILISLYGSIFSKAVEAMPECSGTTEGTRCNGKQCNGEKSDTTGQMCSEVRRTSTGDSCCISE